MISLLHIINKSIFFLCLVGLMVFMLFLSQAHADEDYFKTQKSKHLFSYLISFKSTPLEMRKKTSIQKFIDDNYNEIIMDAATGNGEFLDMLFELLNLSDEDKTKACHSFKLNFSNILITNDNKRTITLRPTKKSTL